MLKLINMREVMTLLIYYNHPTRKYNAGRNSNDKLLRNRNLFVLKQKCGKRNGI